MLIEYDGRPFNGWQVQPDQPTIQEAVQNAMAIVFRREVAVVGSGRTDAGVHARGQVAHFDVEDDLDVRRVAHSLNGLLRPSIVIRALEETTPEFHARYDARMRRYHYYASTEPSALERHERWYLSPTPDFDRMNEAEEYLIGRHAFDSFCRTKSETTNRVCTVYRARWVAEPSQIRERPPNWRFEIVADRFLHGMVRSVVGTLAEVGRGLREPGEIASILDQRDRRFAGAAAPAHGLVLEHVVYDIPIQP